MTITEECINHNSTRLIKELCLSDLGTADASADECKYWLGYIDGLFTLAESLKEVLKA